MGKSKKKKKTQRQQQQNKAKNNNKQTANKQNRERKIMPGKKCFRSHKKKCAGLF